MRRRAAGAFLAVAIFLPGVFASGAAGEGSARAAFAARITQATISSANRSARFSFVATGGIANGFRCNLIPKGKASRFVKCLSPRAYTNLALHDYTFEVYAVYCTKKVCANSTTAQRSFRIN